MSAPVPALIVATEASGENYGAALAASLPRYLPVRWFGIGGDAMADAGVELVAHAREFSVLGIFEVIRHYFRLYPVFRRLLREIDRRRPRFAVLIDSPGLNLHLARQLHRRRIPVIYFVPPQAWAWRRRRVRLLRRFTRKVLCIFPFEEDFFRRAGVDAEYVGHPLVDSARATLSREEFHRRYQLDPGRPTVALLPGSRNQELERHLPALLEAARRLERQQPVQFFLVQASTIDPALLARLLEGAPHLSLTVVRDTPYNVLANCDVAVIASGTATVEALLLETSMVVIYRVASPSWWVGKVLIRTPHYSMVNLIAGRRLVPELIQNDFTPQSVVDETSRLLNDSKARKRIQEELGRVKQRLGPPGAIERASRLVANLVQPPVTVKT